MRVLLYRALGLGDFLTAVPAYRALARAFPAAEVCLAAPEQLRPLAALTGAVDVLLPTAELASPAWPGPAPDLVVNLHGRGPQSTRVLQELGSRRLVAFAREDLGVSGPRWRAEEHEVARWCRLLAESGIPADPADLDLGPPGEAPPVPAATVVHVGAAGAARRWPVDRFAAVARALADSGHAVVLTGVEAERSLALAVAGAAGLPADRVLAGRLGLGRMAALVAAARLVVCGDTGEAHLATAHGIPSVLLFGAMSPALWGPPPTRRQHRVLWHGELAAVPASAGTPHPALLAIGVEEVLDAVRVLERDLLTPPQSR
ncbi:MAG: glycosyltransferase family 9 protein [Actinomycetes bacterium]